MAAQIAGDQTEVQREPIDLVHPSAPPEVDPEHGLPPGFGAGFKGKVLFAIGIAFASFQLFNSAYPILPAQILRAMHVAFLLLLTFGLMGNHLARNRALFTLAWALGIVAFAVGLYQWVEYEPLLVRQGELNQLDIGVGILSLALLFIASWRMMGPALTVIAATFLAYCLFGQYLPSPLNHRGYGLDQIIEIMAFGTEGIYGTPTGVSATYIFLFILFGSFLERAGMIQLFSDVALGLVGHLKGGPAKVAVVSSAFMGMISGSGVANVVTVGQFTIPLMKRFGYRSAFAGGVEATASMGGQIMPPVMGAVAFIMAEKLNLPYSTIATAAIIPALLYYFSAFWAVHLEAGRNNLLGMPKEQCPDPVKALAEKWYLIIPLGVLVYLLFSHATPMFAGSAGLALTVIFLFAAVVAAQISQTAFRVVFWIGLGLVSASFFKYGLSILAYIVIALVLLSLVIRNGRGTVMIAIQALADAARQALPVGLACATVGIVVGAMTLTGLGTSFAAAVVSVGKSSLFLSLVLTMITSLILGMGIPTIPNYIITSSIAAGALIQLGVPELVCHMFVFYFGIMADLTPPVALAAFAAAPIARESGFKIGMQAVKIALPGFVVPYMAVYTPSLMLQDGGALAAVAGYWPEVAYVVVKTLIAIALWGVASIGYLKHRIGMGERVLFAVAAFLLFAPASFSDMWDFFVAVFTSAPLTMAANGQPWPIPSTDIAGFIMAAILVAWHMRTQRALAPRPA